MKIIKVLRDSVSKLKKFFLRKKRRQLLLRLFKDIRPDRSVTFRKVRRWIIEHRYISAAIAIAVVVKVAVSIALYNEFVNLEQDIISSLGDVKSCLLMREDLVPQLVALAGDLIKHEDNVFTHSADARADSLKGGQVREPVKPGPVEQFSLSKLFAIAEQYPLLKTSETFQVLMAKAADVEKELLAKRMVYNAKTFELNKKVASFPDMIYAFLYGFKKIEYIQFDGEPDWMSRSAME